MDSKYSYAVGSGPKEPPKGQSRLWVRVTYIDGRIEEGVTANDLLFIHDAIDDGSFVLSRDGKLFMIYTHEVISIEVLRVLGARGIYAKPPKA